ncbi:MAG: hypothetical protein NTX65_12510 [Ignavibacteriales bacterium]|nr:hypothetical protein [Ignavibacteriales bacterium]
MDVNARIVISIVTNNIIGLVVDVHNVEKQETNSMLGVKIVKNVRYVVKPEISNMIGMVVNVRCVKKPEMSNIIWRRIVKNAQYVAKLKRTNMIIKYILRNVLSVEKN